ncbi:hypothetical protein B9W68_14045 [Streptomyces sp. CS227]|nr:hypothetical protein B9W68_14045 [Streptomyces sp. CS227]
MLGHTTGRPGCAGRGRGRPAGVPRAARVGPGSRGGGEAGARAVPGRTGHVRGGEVTAGRWRRSASWARARSLLQESELRRGVIAPETAAAGRSGRPHPLNSTLTLG